MEKGKLKKVMKGIAIAGVAVTIGSLAGCASTQDMFTAEEVEDRILAAKDDVKCAVCECEPLTCDICECEVCEVCPEPEVVEVDNSNLAMVLDHIYDNDGKVEYLTDTLDDDEVGEIVDRVVFINEVKELSIKEVDGEGIDELDKEVVNGTVLDDKDIERFRIYDDADEIDVEDVDFEDGDADAYVWAKFEQDEVKYKAKFLVEFRDGEIDDFSVESVELR